MIPIQSHDGTEIQQLAGFMEDATTDEQLAAIVSHRESSANAMTEAVTAFEQLYDRHSQLLLAFLSSRTTRSQLEDVHQTVWQKVWQFLPDRFTGGNFRAWLYQISRNHLIDQSRRKRPDDASEAVESAAVTDDPGAPLMDEEHTQILERCLKRLQQDMAEIVRSRLAGENYETICERMNLIPARAHKLFFQAREQVGRCVQKAME